MSKSQFENDVRNCNFKDGNIKVNYRKVNNDIAYHEAMSEKLAKLKAAILAAASEPGVDVTKQWLVGMIEDFHRQDVGAYRWKPRIRPLPQHRGRNPEEHHQKNVKNKNNFVSISGTFSNFAL